MTFYKCSFELRSTSSEAAYAHSNGWFKRGQLSCWRQYALNYQKLVCVEWGLVCKIDAAPFI